MKTHQRYGRAIGAFMIIALSRCGRANWARPPGPLSRGAALTTQIGRSPSLRGTADEDLLYYLAAHVRAGPAFIPIRRLSWSAE